MPPIRAGKMRGVNLIYATSAFVYRLVTTGSYESPSSFLANAAIRVLPATFRLQIKQPQLALDPMPVVANDIPYDNRIFLLPDLPASRVFGDEASMRMALCTNRMFDAHARPLNLPVEFVQQRRHAAPLPQRGRPMHPLGGRDHVITKPGAKAAVLRDTAGCYKAVTRKIF
jgi:hypothetical protein